MLSLRKVCWGMTQVFSNLERKVSSKVSQSWIAVVNTAFLSSWNLHNCGGRQKIKFWTRAFLIVINALKKIKHSDMLDIWRVSQWSEKPLREGGIWAVCDLTAEKMPAWQILGEWVWQEEEEKSNSRRNPRQGWSEQGQGIIRGSLWLFEPVGGIVGKCKCYKPQWNSQIKFKKIRKWKELEVDWFLHLGIGACTYKVNQCC